jgi:two-component system sensor histidine kinase RegB
MPRDIAAAAKRPLEAARVSLRTLIVIRWIAVAGQALTLIVVHSALGFTLPLEIALAVVAISAGVNLVDGIWRGGSTRLGDREATSYLAFDVVQLGALLYLTGGLQNPFALLVVTPVTVGASILSRRALLVLGAVTATIITTLAIWHLPLPWDEDRMPLPALFILAVWLALTLATVFIAAYIFRVTEEGRRLSSALAAAQAALAREQRISAVGALAAAIAHELGSPLGTIAVVATELARDLPPDSPLADDARLLLSETARCRKILADLNRRGEAAGGAPFERLPAGVLVEMAGEAHGKAGIEVAYGTEGNPAAQPQMTIRAETLHGIGTLIQNASQFAKTRVEVTTIWDSENVAIEILDDGPGFPPHLLPRLGEPYLSVRAEPEHHMGLGIFIAETLLGRTGATLDFANVAEGGALVRIEWPRRAFDDKNS